MTGNHVTLSNHRLGVACDLLDHHQFLLEKRRFARSFSAVPLSRRMRRAYSCLGSSPATVARPRVVVSISSGWGTPAEARAADREGQRGQGSRVSDAVLPSLAHKQLGLT